MTLPTNISGSEDGGGSLLPGFAVLDSSPSFVLDPWIQETEHCQRCGGLETVIYAWEFAQGRLGVCLGCGGAKKAPFTRTVGEAA